MSLWAPARSSGAGTLHLAPADLLMQLAGNHTKPASRETCCRAAVKPRPIRMSPYAPARKARSPKGAQPQKRRVAHHNDPPPAREKEELGEKPLRASSSLRGAWKEKTAEGAPQTAFLERRYSIPKEYGFCVNKS